MSNHHGGKPDQEVLDTTPLEMPIGACRPESLQSIIARMMRSEMEAQQGEEFESFEDAEDFEEEDPDFLDFSPYELSAMQAEEPIERGDPLEDSQPQSVSEGEEPESDKEEVEAS